MTEGVLEEIGQLIAAALEPEEDPVRQIAGAFDAYCTVIRDNRQAVLLTYRESNLLDEEGRRVTKELEVRTVAPLRTIYRPISTARSSASPILMHAPPCRAGRACRQPAVCCCARGKRGLLPHCMRRRAGDRTGAGQGKKAVKNI